MNVRHGIRVRGTVQGVGFRPAVYRAASGAGLAGFVQNDAEGVWIEVEGEAAAVQGFPRALERALPPLARIEAIEITACPPRGERDFRVTTSTPSGVVRAAIPADIATCPACVRELFDGRDRRFRYPFINCTDCGPRYTIVRDLPYDRARTTMAPFAMCAECRREYEDPTDRRFHAEPIACAACGPRVRLIEGANVTRLDDAAVLRACALLGAGRIVAIKGLGGWQLACDANDEAAVRRLRERKRRPDKPFAVMTHFPEALVAMTPAVEEALRDPAQPIVLARARGNVAPSVAPRLAELGVMLPTTPLHHLLLRGGPPALVMTSGNVTDEPIAIDDEAAARDLAAVADAFLGHDRGIHTRADDSVARMVGGAMQPVRRGRGWAPVAIAMPVASRTVLATGAELKNALCITRGNEAFVSQHIGDLAHPAARAFFEETAAKLGRLLGVVPAVVAHDFHPDYAATRWAWGSGLRTIAVQHHHAHVASCLVENGETGPAIGVAFDGTGCGPAGDAWGGEILAFDLHGYDRVFHLRPLALPGGEAAIREPWRLGISALVDAGEPLDAAARVSKVLGILAKPRFSPKATGCGRWFDAVAAILGVREGISYEAQAAIELEAFADRDEDRAYPFQFRGDEIDLRPVVRALVHDRGAKAAAAARFHSTLAEIVRASCRRIREQRGLSVVALSGGCFQNTLLSERTCARLEEDGFRVLVHRRLPPNDGGLALGQAAIAASLLQREEDSDVSRHSR